MARTPRLLHAAGTRPAAMHNSSLVASGATDIHLKGKKQVAWMDLCEDLGETDATFHDNKFSHGQVMAYAYETHL